MKQLAGIRVFCTVLSARFTPVVHSIKICIACSVERRLFPVLSTTKQTVSLSNYTEQLSTFCLWKGTTRKRTSIHKESRIVFCCCLATGANARWQRHIPRPPSSTFREELRNCCWNTLGQPRSPTECTKLRNLLSMLQFVPCKSLLNKASSSWEPEMNAAYFGSLHLTPVWWWGIKRTKSETDWKTGCFKAHSYILWISTELSEEKHHKFVQISW